MVKIGVVGCAGYIGSRLVHHLLQEHRWHVVGVDGLLYGGDALLGVIAHPRFQFAQSFLLTADEWRQHLGGCDIVIHAAGMVGEPACSKYLGRAQQLNVTPLEVMPSHERSKEGVRVAEPALVYLSTCSVYGPTTFAVPEEWQPQATGVYARQKIMAEQLVIEKGGLVLRLGTLFGSSPRLRFDLLINEAVRLQTWGGRTEAEGVFFRRPREWRPYLAMSDLLDALDRVIAGGWPRASVRRLNVVTMNVTQADVFGLLQQDCNNPLLTIAKLDPAAEGVEGYQCSGAAFEELYEFAGQRATAIAEIAQLRRAVTLLADPWAPRWRNA